jgi:hypothetical protein
MATGHAFDAAGGGRKRVVVEAAGSEWSPGERRPAIRSELRLPRTTPRAGRGFLVAAAPGQTDDEEKEAITMVKQTAAKGASAKQVAIDVLGEADGPLKAREVVKGVIGSGRCAGLKGKTPEATISAMLAVGSKPGVRSSASTRAPTRSPMGPHVRQTATGEAARDQPPEAEAQGQAANAEAADGEAKRLTERTPHR